MMNDLVSGGGVEKVMLDLINNLPKNEYNITILTPDFDPEFHNYYESSVDYWFINKNKIVSSLFIMKKINNLLSRIYRIKMKHVIDKSNFDIAIAIKEGPSMKFIAELNVPKKLAWIHVDYSSFHWTKSNFKNGQELECMREFEHVICVSNRVKKSVINTIGDPGNLIFKANPIDEKAILEKSKEKVTYHTEENIPLFITVGRLCKEKGYDILLSVCKKLNESGYKYRLDIIGDGKERGKLENYIEVNQLSNIKLLGSKENPYKYLKYADWFISTSRTEGYSLVTQEAAILGIPIIATDFADIKEFLGQNNEYGIVTEINETSIYNAMVDVIENKDLQRYYKERIKERAMDISLDERIQEIQQLI